MKDTFVVVEQDTGFNSAVKIYTADIYKTYIESGMSEDGQVGSNTFDTLQEAILVAIEFRNSRLVKNSMVAEHIMFVCSQVMRSKYIGIFKTKFGGRAHPIASGDLGGYVSFLIYAEIIIDENLCKNYPEFYVC